jgi:glutamyl-tRNA synthetase
MAVTPDGRRLAKRDGSLKLATLREAGVAPRALVGSLIHSCGWTDSVVPSTPREGIARFDPASIPATHWIVTREWLDSLARTVTSGT